MFVKEIELRRPHLMRSPKTPQSRTSCQKCREAMTKMCLRYAMSICTLMIKILHGTLKCYACSVCFSHLSQHASKPCDHRRLKGSKETRYVVCFRYLPIIFTNIPLCQTSTEHPNSFNTFSVATASLALTVPRMRVP